MAFAGHKLYAWQSDPFLFAFSKSYVLNITMPDSPDDLSEALASAKQEYDELTRLVSLDEIRKGQFLTDLNREKIAACLRSIHKHIFNIRSIAWRFTTNSTEAPIAKLPPDIRSFYNDIVLAHGTTLQNAFFKISGSGLVLRDIDARDDDEPEPLILNAITLGLQRWSDTFEEDESSYWYEKGFDVDGAESIVSKP